VELDAKKIGELCDEVESLLQPTHAEPSNPTLSSVSFQELGMDSLSKIRLVSALEERFHITIRDEEALFADTLKQLVSLVQEKLTVRAP
jgi:acyl carrier protein